MAQITDAERNAIFEAGWRLAAQWAERDDLAADIGSSTYQRERNALLSLIDGALKIARAIPQKCVCFGGKLRSADGSLVTTCPACNGTGVLTP